MNEDTCFESILMIAFLAFAFSLIGTAVMKRLLNKVGIMDIPNERSSHSIPIPRGGGIVIILVFSTGIFLLMCHGIISFVLGTALLGGGLLVGIVGFLDDMHDLPASVRFLVHLIAAVWALFWLNGMTEFWFANQKLHLGLWGTLAAGFWIAWMINLFNFMDGIDGLAASETVIAVLAAGVLLGYKGNMDGAFICIVLVGSVLGFLIFNWPPASIFMGDAGSSFIGYIIAVTALITAQSGALPLGIWLIFLAVFVIDATLTLLVRIFKREKWFQAHRQHIYQKLVQSGYSHCQVTILFSIVTMVLASTTAMMLLYGGPIMMWGTICYIILTIAYFQCYSHFH